MIISSWKTCSKALALTGASLLAACNGPSGSEPIRVTWDWQPPLQGWSLEAGAEKKVFLMWKDIEVVREITNMEQSLGSILKNEHELTITNKSDEADYVCQLYLRYFNGNGEADRGSSVLSKAGQICGGRTGWLTPNGPMDGEIVAQAMPDLSDGGSMFGASEWVLLLDVSIGEKGGEPKQPQSFALRQGRLIGHVSGRGLTRDDALWLFKYGKLPPPPPEPVDGVVPASYVPPDPTAPPTELLNVIVEGFLPLVN